MNNDVRQVLMNELGLTRESVRKEAEGIIRDAVERHVKGLPVEKMLREWVDRELKTFWSDTKGLEKAVKSAVQDYLWDLIADSLVVEFSFKEVRPGKKPKVVLKLKEPTQ